MKLLGTAVVPAQARQALAHLLQRLARGSFRWPWAAESLGEGARAVAARRHIREGAVPRLDESTAERKGGGSGWSEYTTRIGVWICQCKTGGRKAPHPGGKAVEEGGRNPEAPPGSGECADPQDNLRLWDVCSILLGPQSEHGASGIDSQEPVHLPGDGVPRGLDGAVSGPER